MNQPWQILKRAAFGGPLTSEQVAQNLGATQPTDGVTPASTVVGRNELLTAIETYLDAQDTLNNHDIPGTSVANVLMMWDRVHRARTQLNIAIKELK